MSPWHRSSDSDPLEPIEPLEPADAEAPNEWKERALRLAADIENIRRRAREEAGLVGQAERDRAVLAMMPVYDSLFEARRHGEMHSPDWLEAITALANQFESRLGELGYSVLAPMGERFDPQEHEAVAVLGQGGGEHVVAEVLRVGVAAADGRVVRAAQVAVS